MPRPKTFARRAILTAGLAIPLLAFRSGDSLFAPSAKAIERWRPHDPSSTTTVDHSAWAAILARLHVMDDAGVARVHYGRATTEDRQAVTAYLIAMAAVPVARLNRSEQIAYWINLYNAGVLSTVLAHYPVRSIQDIDTSPGLFASGPWKAPDLRVGGTALSLDDIEHGIIRPFAKDPRIHYAVNCGAVGCPNLLGEPYVADRLDAQLDAQAAAFVNHPRGVAFDREDRLVVSRIYAWFCEDFGDTDAGVLTHIRQYAAPDLLRRLRGVTRIEDARYDWALNDAAG